MPVGKSSIQRAAQAQKAEPKKSEPKVKKTAAVKVATDREVKAEIACAEAPKAEKKAKKNELPYYLL